MESSSLTSGVLIEAPSSAERTSGSQALEGFQSWFTRRNVEIVAGCILALGIVIWLISLSRMELIGVHSTWFRHAGMGIDFDNGTYQHSRVWLSGENPYDFVYNNTHLVYPPFVMRVFAWTTLLPFKAAYFVLFGLLAASVIGGVLYGLRVRSKANDRHIGPLTAIAAVLFSTPVLFAMERGNYDLLVIPCLVVGAILLRRGNPQSDICAGLVLALAPWLKVYPGLIGLALLATRRWYALGAFVGLGAFIGLMDLPYLREWLGHNRDFSNEIIDALTSNPYQSPNLWWHSLTASWAQLMVCLPAPLNQLGKIPGSIAAVAILAPSALWTFWRFYNSPNSIRLIYPFMLWITALATFFPPIANDYSLVFLPVAAIIVWRHSDSRAVQICMVLLLIWWQPIALPINGRVLFLFKIIGLFAVGYLLLRRLDELDSRQSYLPRLANT